MLQIFAIIDDTLVMNFEKRLQYDFPKMRGGVSKAVWNFSENSSVLDVSGFPYVRMRHIKHLRSCDKITVDVSL